MGLVEVKGWCSIRKSSLLYSIRKRKFINGLVKGDEIIYRLRPGEYIRFEYEYDSSENPSSTITLKLVSIKSDATEEVIASSTIKHEYGIFLRKLNIPQIEDFYKCYTLNEVSNKIYSEEDNERLFLFVIANANINEIEVREEKDRRWREAARRAYAPILRYKDELEKLYKLYKRLPTAYMCLFCNYVSYERFRNCPRCKATVERVKGVKIMTKEYKQLLNDVRAKMGLRMYKDDYGRLIYEGDGFIIYEDCGRMVCETEAGWNEFPEFLPEDVGLPVWAACYLVTGRIEMVDEDAVEAQRRHGGT
jgi:hypothetical protein